MKNLLILILITALMIGCDLVDPETTKDYPVSDYPCPVFKIEKVETTGTVVEVTIKVWTVSSSIKYSRKGYIEYNNDIYSAKIFGKDNGEPSLGVGSTFILTDKILFLTHGEKLIKYWQDDSTSVDTIIVL